MGKKIFSLIIWALGLILLAIICWLLGIVLNWQLWHSVALFTGILVVGLIARWSWRRWRAWRLRQKLATPIGTKIAHSAQLDADWGAGLRVLKNSRLSRFGSHLYVLPWFLSLGPQDEQRGQLFRRVTAHDPVSAQSNETPILRWWMMRDMVMLDAGPDTSTAGIAPSPAHWQTLLNKLMNSRRREPLNGIVLTLELDWLLQSDQAQLAQTGQMLRERIDEIVSVYNARIPIYILLDRCETLAGFSEWAQALGEETQKQTLGFIKNDDNPSVNHFLEKAFGSIVTQMSNLRLILGQQTTLNAQAIDLPERVLNLKHALESLLRPAFQETPYAETPRMQGLFLTGGDHQTSWFTQALFSKVLPNQRHAWEPLERMKHWNRLMRHSAVTVWLLLCTAIGILLLQSAHTADNTLQTAVQNLDLRAADFSGELNSDLQSMHPLRHAIRSLDKRSAWEQNWMPFSGLVNQTVKTLKQTYTRSFNQEVLHANLDPLVEEIKLTQAKNDTTTLRLALAQNLVRRINLLQARLDGKNLETLPSTGSELISLIPILRQEHLSPIDGLLLGDMYRDYLMWQNNENTLIDEKRALQNALQSLGLSTMPIQMIYTWTDLQSYLKPLRLDQFWRIEAQPGLPEIPAAMTVAGYQTIIGFMDELAQATQNHEFWRQRRQQYEQLFLDEGLEYWYIFTDAFIHAPDLLTDISSRRAVLSNLMTEFDPYLNFMLELGALGHILPSGKQPAWLSLAVHLSKMMQLIELEDAQTSSNSLQTKSLTTLQNLQVIQNFGVDILKILPEDSTFRQTVSSLESNQDTLLELQNYFKNINTTARSLQQGQAFAMETAVQIWSYGHDPEVKEVPLIQAHDAFERFSNNSASKSDPRSEIVWKLMAGPLDFSLDFAARSAACGLQNSWETDVLAAVDGVADKELTEILLYGERGQVNAFLEGNVRNFMAREGTRYVAREALNDTVPFSGQFIAFANLAQLRKSQAAGLQLQEKRQRDAREALEQEARELEDKINKTENIAGTVTIHTVPPLSSPNARLFPESITLTLQCVDGATVLENLNFANTQTFVWSMDSCGDTQLAIRYPGFTLNQNWGGPNGFIQFLKTFSSGQYRFTAEQFPAQAEQLKQANVQWVDVIYRQQGQETLLKSANQAQKLQSKAEGIQAQLDALRQSAINNNLQTETTSGALTIPQRIVTMCMGPAKSIQQILMPTLLTTPSETEADEPETPDEVDADSSKATNDPAPDNRQSTSDNQHPWVVQIGIFANPDNVHKALSSDTYTLLDESITLNGKNYHKVMAVGYEDRAQALQAAEQISQLLKLKPQIYRKSQPKSQNN